MFPFQNRAAQDVMASEVKVQSFHSFSMQEGKKEFHHFLPFPVRCLRDSLIFFFDAFPQHHDNLQSLGPVLDLFDGKAIDKTALAAFIQHLFPDTHHSDLLFETYPTKAKMHEYDPEQSLASAIPLLAALDRMMKNHYLKRHSESHLPHTLKIGSHQSSSGEHLSSLIAALRSDSHQIGSAPRDYLSLLARAHARMLLKIHRAHELTKTFIEENLRTSGPNADPMLFCLDLVLACLMGHHRDLTFDMTTLPEKFRKELPQVQALVYTKGSIGDTFYATSRRLNKALVTHGLLKRKVDALSENPSRIPSEQEQEQAYLNAAWENIQSMAQDGIRRRQAVWDLETVWVVDTRALTSQSVCINHARTQHVQRALAQILAIIAQAQEDPTRHYLSPKVRDVLHLP